MMEEIKKLCKKCKEEADVLCKELCVSCFLKEYNIPYSFLVISQSYIFQLLNKYILGLSAEVEGESESGLPESFISKTTLAESCTKILNQIGKLEEKGK